MVESTKLNAGDYIQHVRKWEPAYGGILCYKITCIQWRRSWLTRKEFAVVWGYDASAYICGSRGPQLGRKRILFKGSQSRTYNKVEIVNGKYPIVGWWQQSGWPGSSSAIYANGEILDRAGCRGEPELPEFVIGKKKSPSTEQVVKEAVKFIKGE